MLQAAAYRASASPGASPSPLVRLLGSIEDLDGSATGALVVGPPERPLGAILVEGGRVCWGVSHRMRRRLTDHLCSQADPPLDRNSMERAFRRCRTEGKPLGETLVEWGLVSRDGLRRALRQHTAEAIARLAEEGPRTTRFEPHRERRYDASFTFTTADLVGAIASQRYPRQTHGARALLEDAIGPDGTAAAYAVGDVDGLPLATVRADGLGIRQAVALGAWARALLERARRIDADAWLAVEKRTDGRSGVAWRSGESIAAVLCDDPSTTAWIVTRQTRLRHARV